MHHSRKICWAAVLLFAGVTSESKAQFSIRRNTSNAAAVDILYKAPASGQGSHPAQFFEFSLQIPNPKGGTLTASWAPAAPLAALAGFQAYTGTDYGNTTFAWASTGVPNYSNTYTFPSSEVVLGTVTFSPAASAAGAIVSAIDYQNQPTYGGTGTGVAVWTMQVDASGTDVTNYSSLFYQSAASGSIAGSTAPFTTNDGSVSNQKVSLTATPLPVMLAGFSAATQQCDVVLHWITAAEQNFDHFDVEYSTDGRSYSRLGSINSRHNPAGSTYEYTAVQAAQTGYYRLLMADIDGRYELSNVITARTDCKGSGTYWHVYPNPALNAGNIYVNLNSAASIKNIRLIVSDLLGRKVSDESINAEQGVNQYSMSVVGWPAGTYVVQLYDASGMLMDNAQKLIIE